MATLNSLGPTLVIVVTLLLFGVTVLRITRTNSSTVRRSPHAARRDTEALRIALGFAEVINAYDVSSLSDPRVHLGEIERLKPAKYQEGVLEIQRYFMQGNVVSVDLSRLSGGNAARLVDFCSGLLCGSPGWLFRATDTVIVLTPMTSRHEGRSND